MKSEPIYKEDYKGLTITLEPDEDAESSRDWDNVGTMVCWHKRYNLGDKQPKESPIEYKYNLCELYDEDATPEKLEEKLKNFVILPLYLYDHSGITMSTGHFSCPWDSGQVGFIYCSLDKVIKELCGDRINEAQGWSWDSIHRAGGEDMTFREWAEKTLNGEAKTYDNYLTGNVCGWILTDQDGEDIHSCWNYYPDDSEGYAHRWDYVLSEARREADNYVENFDYASL